MSLKTAGIREFARMIGRSHSWVVSQCQRNIIPKTTDGKIPVDEALKAVARLFATVRARTRACAREGQIDPYRTPSECLCYAVGMSDALPGVAIRQAAKQSSRLAAASLSYTLKAGEGANDARSIRAGCLAEHDCKGRGVVTTTMRPRRLPDLV